jgi:glucose-6-phosphate dehydrogenase assembly protein OpcA
MATDLSPGGIELDTSRTALIRWNSRARSLEDLELELARMWAVEPQNETGEQEAHVQARTSVLNLVVVARRPEIGERAAATISRLTGRHPSRTIILLPADPDGPRWLDAQVQAVCIVPLGGGHETCAEIIYLTAGGDAGRHLDALVTPLLIHDLPVAVWWPGDPPFRSLLARQLIDTADRLAVDGSVWSGSGRDRIVELAEVCVPRVTVCDFALIRQSRWREAIASTFDAPEFLPYLRGIRRIAVTYGTHDESGDPEGTNVVKPIYHVAWLASRLDMRVERPLEPMTRRGPAVKRPVRSRGKPTTSRAGQQQMPGGFGGMLRFGQGHVEVVLRPRLSKTPAGTTLRVELLCERRGSELRTDVTAEAETVHVRVWQDGVEALERRYHAPRRTDTDLLAETIERTGPDPVSQDALRMAAELVGPDSYRPVERG